MTPRGLISNFRRIFPNSDWRARHILGPIAREVPLGAVNRPKTRGGIGLRQAAMFKRMNPALLAFGILEMGPDDELIADSGVHFKAKCSGKAQPSYTLHAFFPDGVGMSKTCMLSCTCKAFRYYVQHALSTKGSLYYKRDNGPAPIRNPRNIAAPCKHCQRLLSSLMARGWLK
jgi:hypothetical protein